MIAPTAKTANCAYQLLDSESCYRCFYSKELTNCDSVDFSYDCKNCKHCFGCTGLRGKEYHLFNTPLKKEAYEAKLAELTLTEHTISLARDRALAEWRKHPRLFSHLLQCEGSTGDNLSHCKNCRDCYDGADGQDCIRMQNIPGDTRDCSEIYGAGYGAELSYQGFSVAGQRSLFSFLIYPKGNDILYSAYCGSCQNLFGCIGMKRKQYCILNKQYSKEEYESLASKIIAHMRKTGEWGEFFPSRFSPFAYNESIAQEFFPLSKEQTASRGLKWREDDESSNYLGPLVEISASIHDVSDDITKHILRCEVTDKPFKIIPQELKFYREMKLPVPKKCPDQRHRERMALRNPRKLWSRECAKCRKSIETTYAPDRPEIVYCEECYLASVY